MTNKIVSKGTKITYWITTGLITLTVLQDPFIMNSQETIKQTEHLGLPAWFRIELFIGLFIGGILLIIPKVPKRLKEWAYVGMGICYLSAPIAHISVGDPTYFAIFPLVFFAILLTSYITYHKMNDN